MLQTDYKHLHLTTIIIIITAREFYSPSCNLRPMRLRFDFGVWFKGRFVYNAVLPLQQTIVISISSPSHFKTNCILFLLQCSYKTIPMMPFVMRVFSKMLDDLQCPMPQRVAVKMLCIHGHIFF